MSIDLPHSPVPRVSILIVAASTAELLEACLRSIARNGPRGIPFETIVVLNDKTAGFAPDLERNVTGLAVVAVPVNLGLAGAANRGRSVAKGEYLIVLHDDAQIEPGWMEALVEAADAHPEAGAIGSKVLNLDGSLQYVGMLLWNDASGSDWRPGEAARSEAITGLRAVDCCGTASVLVRRSVWDAIGGFDERFYPAYYVDADMAMSIRALGRVVFVEPAAVIRHFRGASAHTRFRQYLLWRNRARFREKWATALSRHEPPQRRLRAASVERALARAEAFAAEVRRTLSDSIAPLAPSEPFDAAVQERRQAEMERDLQAGYVPYLIGRLDEAERRLDAARQAKLSKRIKRLWRSVRRG